MKLRTQEAIAREYRRARRELLKLSNDAPERAELYGAMQALAWALSDEAMAPVKAALLGATTENP